MHAAADAVIVRELLDRTCRPEGLGYQSLNAAMLSFRSWSDEFSQVCLVMKTLQDQSRGKYQILQSKYEYSPTAAIAGALL